MNVLLINGSPKGDASNSMRLASAFLDGMRDAMPDIELRTMAVSTADISPCKGCFVCWSKTPGECCMHDDMTGVLKSERWADVTIWSFPLYYFGVPGPLKTLIDRQLPTMLPFMVERSDGVGNGAHPSRFDRSNKRNVLISTCGFYTSKGNYDAVTGMFDHICGRSNYETVFCGQGELFRVRELRGKTDPYLATVRQAGREFAAAGAIGAETRGRLSEPILPKETYETMADASWGIDKDAAAGKAEQGGQGGKAGASAPQALTFTRQMALLYNPKSYSGTLRVVEMDYTDIGEVYQISLTEQEATVVEGRAATATTVIKTPFELWQRIARGEIEGSQALGQGLYTVEGDFSLMLHWDSVFGTGDGSSDSTTVRESSRAAARPPLMLASLLPLTVFWSCVPIDATLGSMVVLGVCALEPLLLHRHELTVYDDISMAMASLLALAMLAGVGNLWAQPASYLLFGAMWAASCATSVPFTAHYVKALYGGDKALGNPLFMSCNRILTLAWAAVFALNAVVAQVLASTPAHAYSGLVVSGLSLLMGLFTKWFQGFYPAWVAAGRPSPLKG